MLKLHLDTDIAGDIDDLSACNGAQLAGGRTARGYHSFRRSG